MLYRLSAGLLALALLSCGGRQDLAVRGDLLADAGAPVLAIAHRGYSSMAPENTAIAVEMGVASGAEYIEIDVQLSADGVVILMHDTTLARTTNAPLLYPLRAPWDVGAFTWPELQRLDAGTWFGYSKVPGDFSYAGEPVPSLRQVLDQLRDRAGLLLEVKSPHLYPGIEQAIATELEAAGWVVDGRAEQALIVQSFDWDSMQRYAAIHPRVPVALLGSPPQDEATWERVSRFAFSINPSHSNIDADAVRAIQQRGFDVSVYTVNDGARMAELIDFGVNGIITDEPARLLRLRDAEIPPREAFTLSNSAISELSGIASSRAMPGVYWGHNDSGDEPRLFAFDRLGRDLGSLQVLGGAALDWEDMASYSTPQGHFLLIGDMGDNPQLRPFITLYVVADPGEPPYRGFTPTLRSLTVQYPDGPRDAEGLAVDAQEGFIYILSKRDPRPRLYRLPLDAPPLIPIVAEYLGEIASLPLPASGQLEPAGSITNVSPTAFSVSADGRFGLIVTLENSYRYARAPGQSWLEALNNPPEIIAVPRYRQIEAGDFIGDGPGFVIGSEQLPAEMFALPDS